VFLVFCKWLFLFELAHLWLSATAERFTCPPFNVAEAPSKTSKLIRFSSLHFRAVPSPRGALVSLGPQTKLQASPNWNMKHYKLVEFLSNLNVKHPCTNVKPPFWRQFCFRDNWGWPCTAVHMWLICSNRKLHKKTIVCYGHTTQSFLS